MLLVFLKLPGDLHPGQYCLDPIQQRAGASGIQAEGHPCTSSTAAGRGWAATMMYSMWLADASGGTILHELRHGGVIWTTLVLRASIRVAKPALAGRQPA